MTPNAWRDMLAALATAAAILALSLLIAAAGGCAAKPKPGPQYTAERITDVSAGIARTDAKLAKAEVQIVEPVPRVLVAEARIDLAETAKAATEASASAKRDATAVQRLTDENAKLRADEPVARMFRWGSGVLLALAIAAVIAWVLTKRTMPVLMELALWMAAAGCVLAAAAWLFGHPLILVGIGAVLAAGAIAWFIWSPFPNKKAVRR